MATNTLSNAIVPELLRDDNYANWSSWMKIYLLAQDLWGIVEANPEPEDVDRVMQSWRKINAAALHAILISCEVDILSQIGEISSAKTVWDKLATMYGAGNPLNIPRNSLVEIPINIPVNSRVEILSEIREASSTRDVWDKIATRHEIGNSSNIPGSSAGAASIDNDLLRYEDLCTAINNGDWDGVQDFLERHPDARTARVSVNGRTALHVAVLAGREGIVERLVAKMAGYELEKKDKNGVTALAQAAILPKKTQMVKCMLRQNSFLLEIPDNWGRIPLIRALEYENIEVARLLVPVGPPSISFSDIQASTVLTLLIYHNIFDVALGWLEKFPRAAIVTNLYSTFPLAALASMSSAFPSGNKLGFRKAWIYNSNL